MKIIENNANLKRINELKNCHGSTKFAREAVKLIKRYQLIKANMLRDASQDHI